MGRGEQSGTTHIDGRALVWREVGEGPPLLLVNGYAATAADWDPTFLAELAAEFRVICPDNRGMGGSDLGQAAEVSIEAMASDLLALLDERGIDRVAVAGWSMGGFIVQRLTALAPERVEALVLLSTNTGGAGVVATDPGTLALLTDHSGTPREQASRLISVLFPAPVAEVFDRDFGEAVADARACLTNEALSAQEAAMGAWFASEPEHPGARWPRTLIASGSEDLISPAQNSELLGERYPGSSVEIFAGGGHAFMAQEPVRLAKLIKSFLER